MTPRIERYEHYTMEELCIESIQANSSIWDRKPNHRILGEGRTEIQSLAAGEGRDFYITSNVTNGNNTHRARIAIYISDPGARWAEIEAPAVRENITETRSQIRAIQAILKRVEELFQDAEQVQQLYIEEQ